MTVAINARSRPTRRDLLQHALAAGIGAPAVLGFGRSADAGPEITGRWSGIHPWPQVGIHAHLLPASDSAAARVLTFQDDDVLGLRDRNAGFSKAYVVEIPTNGAPRSPAVYVPNNVTNLFCSGHTFLPDGRLLVAGGHDGRDHYGSMDLNIFSGPTYKWESVRGALNAGRWYGSVITLATGEALIISGEIAGSNYGNPLPQVWGQGSGLRDLSTAILELRNYPVLYVAPDGRVFVAGPDQATRYLDTRGTGKWSTGPKRLFGRRVYGLSATYGDGKILVAAGATAVGAAPTNTTEIIDLQASSPKWRQTGSLRFPRKHANATLLPDGTILVTGGSRSTAFNDAAGAIFAAELWSSSSETWSTLASAQIPRIYHSCALLLPDGRVLSLGGGRPKAKNGGQNNNNAEIFEPPYLFDSKGSLAVRPAIVSAPTSAGYGQNVFVGTSGPGPVQQVTLVRLSSVTHTFNMNQRFQRASFTLTTGGVIVAIPGSRNLVPPGHYMLFVLRGGVPSVARIIRIG